MALNTNMSMGPGPANIGQQGPVDIGSILSGMGSQIGSTVVGPAIGSPAYQEQQSQNQLTTDQSQIAALIAQLQAGVTTETNANQLAATETPGLQAGITSATNTMNQYGTASAPSASSTYPSFPNSAGAGSQTAGSSEVTAGASGDPNTGAPSYGFSPWSLTGEALTRK